MSTSKEKIISFLSDENLEELESQMDLTPNIFEILKSKDFEIRHSNMLAYLLNPSENHGLGSKFVEKFLREIGDDPKLFLVNYDSFIVKREWENIDLLLYSSEDKIVVAIENKIHSGEHSEQLKTYWDRVEKEKEFEGYKKHYIYLTLEGEDAPYDTDIWRSFGYQTIIELLEKQTEKTSLSHDIGTIISHYIKTIKELLEMEDPKITKLKNEVFQKHRKIILELAKLEESPRAELSNMLNDFFDKWGKEHLDYIFDKKNNTYKYFYTSNLSEIMPDKKHLYYRFWINNNSGEFKITISLGIWSGYSDQYKDVADKLYKTFLGNGKTYRETSLQTWQIQYFDSNGDKKSADEMKAELETILFDEIPKLEENFLAKLK